MKFKVYRSTAGSGKTFTLTKEFLKLALCGSGEGFLPDYYRSILAVTFTNDAAGEMKERIVKSLAEISRLGPSQTHPLLDLLYEETEALYEKTEVSPQLCELRNMITVAYLIVKCAEFRHESRGLHFNTDYPGKSNKEQNIVL